MGFYNPLNLIPSLKLAWLKNKKSLRKRGVKIQNYEKVF